MKAVALPFNRIVLTTAQGPRHLTLAEFEAMALTERVRALLERRLAFYQDQTVVQQNDALRALRERRV